jgi:hypothetical protein
MQISKHHYAKALAKLGNKVYYINPPSLSGKFFEQKEVEKGMFVISYSPIFRGSHILPKSIFNLLIRFQIKLLYLFIGCTPDILWSFTSKVYYNLSWFRAKYRIFHPMDQLNNEEAINIGKSVDIILTCSNYIVDELNVIDKPKLLVSHGVSPEFINYPYRTWKKSDILNICYVGNLFFENLDRFTIRKIIQENESHHFHFIGATEPKNSNISAWKSPESSEFVDFLKSAKNVTCYGAILSDEIPPYLEQMDAFLVCYKPNAENVISNSHKILEYLSSGRVVISTFVQHYKDSKYIQMLSSSNSDEFMSLYDEVTRNIELYNSEVLQEKRKGYAQLSSYDENVIKVEKFIMENTK